MQRPLSDLEQKVMDVIWRYDKCTVRDVLKALSNKHNVAYTTVATIIHRLENKGLVTKKENDYAHIYKPKISRDTYAKRMAQSIIKKFIQTLGNSAIASIAEGIDELPDEKRKYLLQLLQNHADQ